MSLELSLSASAPVWQLQRPTGRRLQVAVLAGVIGLAAGVYGASRTLALRADVHQLTLTPSTATPTLGGAVADTDPAVLQGLSETRIVSHALRYVRQRYVDPDRVDAPAMLESALQALAHAVGDLLVEVPARDASGAPEQLLVRVRGAELRVDARAVQTLHQLDWALHRVIGFLVRHVPRQALEAHVEYVAVNGLLDTLDPYSAMLDPDAWQEMRTHTGGQFGGLGIRILTIDGVLTVVGVIPRSPAARVGMRADDQILRIDGEDTLNMSIEDAVDRLRGKVGSAVRLRLGRATWKKPRDVRVVRAVIQLESVEGRLLPGDVAYARIKNFQRGTAEELRALLDRLAPQDGLRGLVLDLRRNPGGLLDEAVKVCDLLMDGGPVVITVAGGGRDREVRAAKSAETRADLPVAVLVNRRSASASEIVAGALKESNRAVLLGERTWGKGTVQVPFEIGDGALKLTVAKYLVPGDVSIQDVGVTPDIELRFVEARSRRMRLFEPRSHRVRRKAWARKADEEAERRKPMHRLRLLLPARNDGAESATTYQEQEPIRRAAALLRTAGDPHAATLLSRARRWLSDMGEADTRALAARLKPLGVDWRRGPRHADPKLSVTLEPVILAPPKTKAGSASAARRRGGDPQWVPGQPLQVTAGKSARVGVRVTNRGTEPVMRLHVYSQSDAPALDGVERLVGRLMPGQSKLVQLRLHPGRRHLGLQVPVTVVVAQDGKPLGLSRTATVHVKAQPRPAFAWRVRLVETLKDDGLLSPGERATVEVEVKNVGPGQAARPVISLRSLAGRLLHLEKGRARLKPLKPGEVAKTVFAVRGVKGRGSRRSGLLAARLEVTDERLGVQRSERVLLPWRGLAATPADLKRVRAQAKALVGRWSQAPLVTLEPTSHTPSAQTAPCTLRLRGSVRFESVAPGRRSVTVAVGGVKRAYLPGGAQGSVPVDVGLTLDKGLNRITILARAGRKQATQTHALVHCTVPHAASPEAPQAAPAQGAHR